MSDIPTNPAGPTGATPPTKPALAPGVRSQVMLPNATHRTGPGLSAAPSSFNPGLKPSLGAPKSRLRTVEPQATPIAASYKVSVPETTQSSETFPVSHVIASGLAAAVALAAAFLMFLKY